MWGLGIDTVKAISGAGPIDVVEPVPVVAGCANAVVAHKIIKSASLEPDKYLDFIIVYS